MDLDELERLVRLREDGTLTEQEFTEKKAQWLSNNKKSMSRFSSRSLLLYIGLTVTLFSCLGAAYLIFDKYGAATQADFSQAEFIISEDLLRDGIVVNDIPEGPNPICSNQMVKVGNVTGKWVSLSVRPAESDVLPDEIGTVESGQMLNFNVGEAGNYIISDLSRGVRLFAYKVVDCDSADESPVEPTEAAEENQGSEQSTQPDQNITERNILLSCSLLNRNDSPSFQISISSIKEPVVDAGSSHLWSAKSEAIGDIPVGLSRNDQVIYGGWPGNEYLYFEASELRIYNSRDQQAIVAGKWQEDTMMCGFKDNR